MPSHPSQPRAAGAAHTDPRLTPVPAGPFSVGETEAFGAGYWKTPVRGVDGKRLCTVIEREYMPKESGAVRAAFIVHACNSHSALVEALEQTLTALESFPGIDGHIQLGNGSGMTLAQARAALAQATHPS